MITLNVKQENSSSSPLSLSTPQEEPTISFSEFLKGVGKKDAKLIQNGSFVLSLDAAEKDAQDTKASSKSDSLLSLLKNSDKDKNDVKELLELNPKITENLSTADIKSLVADAKKFLKAKILSSEEYKKSQIKELPKTLKGLAEMAGKFGIDVSKITLEEVQSKKASFSKTVSVELEETKNKSNAKTDPKDSQVDVDAAELQKQVKSENATKVKATPLFKAQTSSSEHTTEQLVHSKISNNLKSSDDKSIKNRADETLKLLLRGEKASHSSSNLTADFSVATAKVIAPSATSESKKSLENLLHGDKKESSDTNSKLDGLATHKADSFEVKLNEAKQMIKYLSNDVKNAIDNYKAPFTRVKVQLNPQKLGEVDLTIVQRGKNLHVNISSNNTAIHTLSMNASELKTQLNNSGINNASLNFNSGSDNSGANQQQGQRQNEQRAHEEYSYFENEEQNEEILSSLEIVVPRYI